MNKQQTLQIYDTYRRKIIPFESINPTQVRLYACGPTVYDFAHIGNLRTYLLVDVLRRVLSFNDYQVKHVMNITDVGHLVSDADDGEDKMEKGSRLQNKSAWDIALFFEQQFIEDMTRLNILKPQVICRATDHINEQIEFIQIIEKNGFTYQTSDGIYFDTSKLADYGYLARLDIQGLQAGKRVDIAQKKNITDFALWKLSGDQTRQMEWQSPWGKGFPGWHIECSAMAKKYLGDLFDIHIGGEDHIPVHHSNEIAQSHASHGTNMANYWLHGYFLQIDKEKVAKSGKSLTLNQLIERGYDPLAYRYLVLTSHYRSRLNFTWDSLDAATTTLNRLRKLFIRWPDGGEINPDYAQQFTQKINFDLNMPQALAVVWSLVQADISDADKKATLNLFDQVLGLDLSNYQESSAPTIPTDIIQLAEKRQLARINKNWAESDRLRNEILQRGYIVKDLAVGYQLEKH